MRPNPQFPADLVTFTEEILYGKLHFLCCDFKICAAVLSILHKFTVALTTTG